MPQIRALLFCLMPLLLACGTHAHAQATQWRAFKNTDAFNETNQSIVGIDGAGTYIFSHQNTAQSYITKHNHGNFGIAYTTPIVFNEKSAEVQDVMVRRDSTTVFYSVASPFKNRSILWATTTANAQNQTAATVRRLSETNNNAGSYDPESLHHTVRTTPDLSTAATIEISQSKPRTKVVKVVFFDSLLHQIRTHTYTANYQYWKVNIEDFLLDTQGNAYILIAYENEMQRRKTIEQIHYEVIKCYKNAPTIAKAYTSKLKLPYDELHLKINENAKKIILTGFYYNLKSEVYDGTVYQNFGIDSLENIGDYLVPFSQNLTSKFSQTFAETNSRLNDLSIRKIINRSDSGLVIIAEVNYKVAQNMSFAVNPAMGRELFYRHFGEIIVLCTDKNNAMAWEQLIPKNQICRDDAPFGSFFLLQKLDKLSFFFNETLEPKNPLYQIDITNSGTMQPRGIVAENFIGFLEGGKQISEKTIWIQGIKKREKGILQIVQP